MFNKIVAKFKQHNPKPSYWQKAIYLLLAIYLIFLGLDLFVPGSGTVSSALKWLSIWLIFLAQAYAFVFDKRAGWEWALAAGLTVLADYFLLFTIRWSWGIAFYILAQFCRLYQQNKRTASRLAICLLVAGIVLSRFFVAFISLGVIYAVLLIANSILAFESKQMKLIWAYVLFILCDLSVLGMNFSPWSWLQGLTAWTCWLFYLPSQALLADYAISE